MRPGGAGAGGAPSTKSAQAGRDSRRTQLGLRLRPSATQLCTVRSPQSRTVCTLSVVLVLRRSTYIISLYGER
eukprot:scaffold26288_cov111-Isochrysis_galbana.AAC.11